MVNQLSGTTQFEMDDLQPAEYVALRDLNVGEVTPAFKAEDENQIELYKIILLRNRTKPHRANLKDDYMVLHDLALMKKQEDAYLEWMDEKIDETYIRIDNSFAGCRFQRQGWLKN
jgi:peptidyl-prolyl cis-trans isomerase SurA